MPCTYIFRPEHPTSVMPLPCSPIPEPYGTLRLSTPTWWPLVLQCFTRTFSNLRCTSVMHLPMTLSLALTQQKYSYTIVWLSEASKSKAHTSAAPCQLSLRMLVAVLLAGGAVCCTVHWAYTPGMSHRDMTSVSDWDWQIVTSSWRKIPYFYSEPMSDPC